MLIFALGLLAALWALSLASVVLDLPNAVPIAVRPPPVEAPLVAILVPARDEAHQIEACLRSLLSQDWPNLRVVCVDDRSEDGTWVAAKRCADPRLELVRGSALPAGWLGKNHANTEAVARATDARFFLFTDADTVHAPSALSSAMAAMGDADLLTVLGEARAETFWERMLLPHVLANLVTLFPLRRVNDPRSRVAIANGQYLLIRREAYDAVGGHAAIRDRVADDLELARLVKRSGRRLRAVVGRHLYSVRMYTSFSQIWWGFAKNAAAGAGGPIRALLGVLLILASVAPFYALPFLRGPALLLAATACALALLQRALVFHRLFPVRWPYVLALPLAQAIFAGIAIHSAARQLLGKGPRWKGRSYPHGR